MQGQVPPPSTSATGSDATPRFICGEAPAAEPPHLASGVLFEQRLRLLVLHGYPADILIVAIEV